MKLVSIIAASCCLAALTSVAQAQDIFSFDGQPTSFPANQIFAVYPVNPALPPYYAPKTLAADNNPLRLATFSESGSASPLSSFEFANSPGYGTNLSGVYLINADNDPNAVLTITFAQPITSLSFDFAVNNFTTTGVPDASLSVNGVTATGAFNSTSANFEGVFNYNPGAPFSVVNVQLIPGASGDFGYAIDNLTVFPAASTTVPEPGIVALGAAGLVTVAGLLRRRKK